MAHIVEFSVTGLSGRNIPVEYVLDRNLNIFFGQNGCGKTSLLKILHSAMTGNSIILENVPFKDAIVKIYSIDYDKIFTRKISKQKNSINIEFETNIDRIDYNEYKKFRMNHRLKDAPSWRYDPQAKFIKSGTNGWKHQYLPTSRLHVLPDGGMTVSLKQNDFDDIFTEERLDAYFAESVRQLWMKYSSSVFKDVRTAQEKGLTNILKAVLSPAGLKSEEQNKNNIDSEEAFRCVSNFLMRQINDSKIVTYKVFKAKYESDVEFSQIVSDIINVEKEIDTAIKSRNLLKDLIEKLYSGNKKITFDENNIYISTDSGDKIGLSTLSSGEKHLMRIFVETLLAESSSILIDEPEISLHIDWQRDLVNIMRLLNPSAQFILATHSPEVIADIPDERLISL